MLKAKNLGTALHQQWGGNTTIFFAYTHFSHDLIIGLLVALLPLIRESLGLNYLQSGLLISAFAIASGISQLPGGWLGDRFSRYIVMIIGLGGISLAAVSVGLSPAYYPMLAILAIMGIFSGAYHPSATSLLAGHFEDNRRGKAIALHIIGGSIGFTASPILGGLIARTLGWRFAFIIMIVPALAAILLILKKFRRRKTTPISSLSTQTPITEETLSQPASRSISVWQVLRYIAVIAGFVIFMQFVSGSAMSFIPLYLVDKHHLAPSYAAMLIGIIRGGGIVGSLLGGWLADRWGKRNAILLTLVATGPTLYLLTRLPFNTGLLLVFCLFGMIAMMRQTTFQTFLMDSTPPHLRATVFGIFFGLTMEGASLIQPVAGYFMDIFGIVEVFNVLALTGLGLSLVSLLLTRQTKLRR